MKQLQLMLHDRRRRQRGSILSGLLIIVAFLAILVGALLTELTDSFTVSRELADRFNTEATATSAVEFAIHQLQVDPVPAVCVQDASTRGPWYMTLNGRSAFVTQTCSGILPELLQVIGTGSFTVDGVRDTTGGANRYLVTSSSGFLYSYSFGQTALNWPSAIGLGGAPTAPPMTKSDPNGYVDLLVPLANQGAPCFGHCVALYLDTGVGTPMLRCDMAATAVVTAPPGAEQAVGTFSNFPGYAFFGDAAGNLYAYDASAVDCALLHKDSGGLGGAAVGAPLVFPGTRTSKQGITTTTDDVFIVVTAGASTWLEHWKYVEVTGSPPELNLLQSLSLNIGGNAVGRGASSTVPPLMLAVATQSGRLAVATVTETDTKSGPTYSTSLVSGPTQLPSAVGRAPYWCHCPTGDLIGVGGTNGSLYLLNTTTLAVAWSYSGLADGSPAINTTPMADAKGDWYFGANDGAVYDVEIPVSGSQMFKAARISSGGTITSSPVVAGCANGPCVYFASSTASYLLRIGTTRISELRACVSASPGSPVCAANPRLWARVQVGPSLIWGGSGVFVEGWSFYSP